MPQEPGEMIEQARRGILFRFVFAVVVRLAKPKEDKLDALKSRNEERIREIIRELSEDATHTHNKTRAA